MKTEDIKQLLEDFYNGETTVEQEQLLIRYFENENIAEELQKDKVIFLQFYQGDSLQNCPHLETKLSQLIDELAVNEKSKIRQIWLWIGSIAASFLLLISFGLLFYQKNNDTSELAQHTEYKDTFDNPEDAAIEVEKALMLLATNYNKGIDQVMVAVNNIEKTNEIIRKTFK
jgi:hypothetical protein